MAAVYVYDQFAAVARTILVLNSFGVIFCTPIRILRMEMLNVLPSRSYVRSTNFVSLSAYCICPIGSLCLGRGV